MTDIVGGILLMVGGGALNLAALANLRGAAPSIGRRAIASLKFSPFARPDAVLDLLMERAAAALDA